MTPRIRLVVGVLFFSLCAIPGQRAASPPPDPDKDPQLLDLFKEAKILIEAKKPQAALEKYEKVIASFKAHYANSKSKIYCARGTTESATYLVMAAAAMTKGEFDKDKKNAITLSSTWADAYFMKAYALQDLGRIADAKSAVHVALELSPLSSRYLSELGSIYVLEKNWAKAQEVFEKAEDNASLSPDDSKAEDLGKARRAVWGTSSLSWGNWTRLRKSISSAWRQIRRTRRQSASWSMSATCEPRQKRPDTRPRG